jgi:uncharacterized membrane protein (DUF2068 family)
MKTTGDQNRPKDRLMTLIVIFKFFKGALLIAVALGARHLVNRDVGDFAEHLVDSFRVDPDNRYIHALLEKAQFLSAKQLKELSIGSFFYAAIVLTEGTGLALRKHWAEYFTITVTASFLPLEIIELARRVTPIKISVMAINLAILGYLIARVFKKPAPCSG